MNRVVVVGGGPGGYEAALVAAQLGAEVTVVDTDGVGGSAVLTDCVPSKTLIATAELRRSIATNALEAVELDRPEWTKQQHEDEAKRGSEPTTDVGNSCFVLIGLVPRPGPFLTGFCW